MLWKREEGMLMLFALEIYNRKSLRGARPSGFGPKRARGVKTLQDVQ